MSSWLNNPLGSINDSKDLSITEIDVLDQYVNDLMSITQDIKTPRASLIKVQSGKVSSLDLMDVLELHKQQATDQNVRTSVQGIIDLISKASNKNTSD